MTDFKKTLVAEYSHPGNVVTEDTKYWGQLGFPSTVKEYGGIDYIDFAAVEPHFFAVTSSVKVDVYNPVTNAIHRRFTRFKGAAHGATFRRDGQLVVAGGEDRFVQVFDVASRTRLRSFRGHEAAVHRCHFTVDQHQVVSHSDDWTTRLWDLATATCVQTYREHSDYVRAGAVSLVSQGIFFSASYDHKVKMYDSRLPGSVITATHGSPIEALLVFPSGGVFISAGGTDICVWDAIAGGRLLARVSPHHKTVTCLTLASDGRRLLSGSLDKMVKVLDVANYQAVHSLGFPSAILGLGVSLRDKTLVVGMADGLLSIQHRREAQPKDTKPTKIRASYRQVVFNTAYRPAEGDIIVGHSKKEKLPKYDRHLRRFEHGKALDVVMKRWSSSANKPEEVVAVFQQLCRRDALKIALAGRGDSALLGIIIGFVMRFLSHPEHARVMIDVCHAILDIYGPKAQQLPKIRRMLKLLSRQMTIEMQVMEKMMSLKGSIELLLAAAANSPQTTHVEATPEALLPAEADNDHGDNI